MTGAEDGDGFAGEARSVPARDVRHREGDFRPRIAYSDRRQAARACRIGGIPRPGGIDHGVRAQHLRPFAVLISDLEGRLFAAWRLRLVETDPAHGGDAAGCTDD